MTERVLITGAAGRIGTILRSRLARPGRVLRLLDRVPVPVSDGPHPSSEEYVVGSLADAVSLRDACENVDAVIHLAGHPDERSFAEILAVNVVGTQEILEAARAADIGRVVLASSNHAVGFAERGTADAPDDLPPRPDTWYGWSKTAMESMGRMYVDRFGMDVVCLRIGSCANEPYDVRSLATWLSPDDAGRLFEASLHPAARGFHLVWGVSANTRSWWSPDGGRAIGYHPADDAESWATGILARRDATAPGAAELRRVGGTFPAAPLGVPMS